MTIAPIATALPTPAQQGLRLSGVPALFELPMPVDTAVNGRSVSNTAADEDADSPVGHAEGTIVMLAGDGPIAVAEVRLSAEIPSVLLPPAAAIVAGAPAPQPSTQSVRTIGTLPGAAAASIPNAPDKTLPIDGPKAVAETKIPESAETGRSHTPDRSPKSASIDRAVSASGSSLSATAPSLPGQPNSERSGAALARAPSVRLEIASPTSTQPETFAAHGAPSVPVRHPKQVAPGSDLAEPRKDCPTEPRASAPVESRATAFVEPNIDPVLTASAVADRRAAPTQEIGLTSKATPPPQLATDTIATTTDSAAATTATASLATAVDTENQATEAIEGPLQPTHVRTTKDNIVRPFADLQEQIEAQSIGAQIARDIAPGSRRTVTIPPQTTAVMIPAITERVPIEHATQHAFQRAGKPSTEPSTDQLLPGPIQYDGNAAFAAPTERPDGVALPIASGMTASVPATASSMPVATLSVLDIDSGGQWIDRLALEISTAAKDGGARLKLTPDNLGELTIAIRTGDSGASVVITTQDEAVRSMLAGAQERLVSEARAHGLRLADVQTHLSGDSGAAPQQNSHQLPQPVMWDGDKQPKRMMWMQSDNHEEALSTGRWA